MTDIRLGRVPDPPDARDHPLAAHVALLAVATLPASYYALPYPVVLDQGATPRCVGYSGASYRASEEKRDERRTLIFDADDLYAQAKLIDGDPGGAGTFIRAAAKQLTAIGGLVKTSPVTAEIGERHKIASYARLGSIADILRAIQSTGGAWLGSSWFNSWFSPVNGVLPVPDAVAGGHAYRAVGWRYFDPANPAKTQLRCVNSWGTRWGQSGRFWLPAKYIDFNDFDCWATIDVAGDL